MRECPVCFSCYVDSVTQCPVDGRSTFNSLPGDVALEGKYVLERRLGEGGMGVVYKAHHKFLKTTRAIKIIKPELVGNDASFATRFHQEAMAAAAIGHPNIISVPDFGFLEEKIPFIVMEYVEGISLQDLMTNEGQFTPKQALEYIRVIASAVGAAHAHGIVHRDLKPLNIMITKKGTVREQIRILDFGLAKIKSADLLGSFVGAKTTGIIGSPYYMAPEQWSDEETDKRCDVYSLGIILYQMLTGDVPFKGSSIPAIMKKHLMSPPPALALSGAGISPQLERVVHHALEKDPRQRTASVEDLVAELEQAVLEPAAKAKTRTRTKTKTRTTVSSRAKAKDSGRVETGPPSAEMVVDSFEAKGRGEISAQDLNTIVQPTTRERIEAELVSSKPPAHDSGLNPTTSDADLLRRTEEARRRAEERAIRGLDEARTPAPVAGNSSFRQSTPPKLPGHYTEGQHSVVGGFFRKPFMLPVAAVVLILGVIGLFLVVYFRPEEPAQHVVKAEEPPKPKAPRDMVLIEGGTFMMGWDSGDPYQRGRHSVSVKSFYIDKYEVTNADYAEFIKAEGRPAPTINESDPDAMGSYWKPWSGNNPPQGRERWPVCNVSVKDAEDFAQWLSNRDGVRYRLPTEEEWEFAARNGSKGTLFPWGDTWKDGVANFNGKSSPTDVGSFPQGATQAGVLDMLGNVWEWTSSKAKFYNGTPVKKDPNGRVRRGGSFAEVIKEDFQNATDRGWLGDETFKFPTIGFRLVRDQQ